MKAFEAPNQSNPLVPTDENRTVLVDRLRSEIIPIGPKPSICLYDRPRKINDGPKDSAMFKRPSHPVIRITEKVTNRGIGFTR